MEQNSQAKGKKILISGGSGFIGSYLNQFFYNQQHTVVILTRNAAKIAYPHTRFVSDLNDLDGEPMDIVINLAGAPIDKRWSSSYKKELIESRVGSTERLITWMKKQEKKPEVFIAASAVGYYGSYTPNELGFAEELTEKSGHKAGFTHELCAQIEQAAEGAKQMDIRTVIPRFGVVLASDAGMIKKLLPSFKLGLGGKIGSGKQILSWVHIDDVLLSLDFLIKNQDCEGVFNLTAPNPVTNEHFTHALGEVLKKPTLFTIPSPMVKLIFGEMGNELLLKGQRVLPQRLLKLGFQFSKPTIKQALATLRTQYF